MKTAKSTTDVDQLLERLRTSDASPRRIGDLRDEVERLCSEYSTEDPDNLRSQTEKTFADIDALVAGRLTLADHQAVLEQAGWLALLLAALAYDIGQPDAAEKARQLALGIGHDLDNRSLLGWAHETSVWIEISKANWVSARRKAAAGLDIAGPDESTGVTIQLALQQAEAAARLGEVDSMNDALERARKLLAAHRPPANPKHHFRFDHAKFDLREMRILLIAGRDDEAEQVAARLYDDLQKPGWVLTTSDANLRDPCQPRADRSPPGQHRASGRLCRPGDRDRPTITALVPADHNSGSRRTHQVPEHPCCREVSRTPRRTTPDRHVDACRRERLGVLSKPGLPAPSVRVLRR